MTHLSGWTNCVPTEVGLVRTTSCQFYRTAQKSCWFTVWPLQTNHKAPNFDQSKPWELSYTIRSVTLYTVLGRTSTLACLISTLHLQIHILSPIIVNFCSSFMQKLPYWAITDDVLILVDIYPDMELHLSAVSYIATQYTSDGTHNKMQV
jgi:hypothetical protein